MADSSQPSAKTPYTPVGCIILFGCLGLGLIVGAFLVHWLPTLPGASSSGVARSAVPDVLPSIQAVPLSQVVLLIPSIRPEPLVLDTSELPGFTAEGMVTEDGNGQYRLTLDEASANELVRRLLAKYPLGERYRNVTVDLQKDGMTVDAEADLGLGWQQVGLVFVQQGLALQPERIVISGVSLGVPDGGPLGSAVAQVAAGLDVVLQSAVLAGPLPGVANVSDVQFSDDKVVILARVPTDPDLPADTH